MKLDIVTNSEFGLVQRWVQKDDGKHGLGGCYRPYIQKPANGGSRYFNSLAVSPNGKYFCTMHDEKSMLWDISVKLKTTFKEYGCARAIAISNYHVAIASLAGLVFLFDYNGKLVRKLKTTCSIITSISFSPDDCQLASSGTGGTVLVWKIADGTHRTIFRYKEWIMARAVAWSPSGKHIAIISGEDDSHVLEVKTCCVMFDLPKANVVVYSPTEKIIVATDNNIQVMEAANGKLEHIIEKTRVRVMAISPDGKFLAFTRDSDVSVWNIESGVYSHVQDSVIHISGISFIADRQAIIEQQNVMFAVAIVMDQRQLPDDLFIPPEIWSQCFDYITWHSWTRTPAEYNRSNIV